MMRNFNDEISCIEQQHHQIDSSIHVHTSILRVCVWNTSHSSNLPMTFISLQTKHMKSSNEENIISIYVVNENQQDWTCVSTSIIVELSNTSMIIV